MADGSKTLAELGLAAPGRDPAVQGLAHDSAAVRGGFLFAALPGAKAHGAQYAARALEGGAAAILTDAAGAALIESAGLAAQAAEIVVVEDPRRAYARAAAAWFERQPETAVAVTGTNGKTSVASFARQIWTALGHEAVSVGTTGVEGALKESATLTTPDPLALHRILSDAAAAGAEHVAMEASSHGLEQRRLDGVRLAAAAFTNLTRDHLDYHPTPEAYRAAKEGLFSRVLPAGAAAIVNVDDPSGDAMAAAAAARGCRNISVGGRDGADLRILARSCAPAGQTVRFEWGGRALLAELDLVGDFQGANVLLAAALAIGAGEEPEPVFAALGAMRTVRGRMQLAARRGNGAAVFVDYAHTPDAIASALRALRPHVMGNVVAIIGAGGDRDPGKRSLMGAAAAQGADAVIVTDDNPRREDPAAIRAEVMRGCPDASEIGDRAEAIVHGVAALAPGDALLIAGKGHETGQTVGDDVFPFDDAEHASVAVAALEGRAA